MNQRHNRNLGYMVGIVLLFLIGLFIRIPKVNATVEYQYLIKVNKQQNCITIYERDATGEYTQPVKAMVCSTGDATPLGTYNTKTKYRWKILLDDVWGQYATRITGSILFHSVWYYKQDPSTLSSVQYNKLGTTCSHGCIRLTVEDSKWIYDNCPLGATVVIYNSSDPGPLGKPKAQKLPWGTGWDPTDPDTTNPIYQKIFQSEEEVAKPPTITGVKSKTIPWGSKFIPLEGVKAYSYKKVDLTKKIQVDGTVNTKVAGNYKITYRVKDDKNKETTVNAVITVEKCPYKLKLKGVSNQSVQSTQQIDEAFCREGVQLYLNNKKLTQSKLNVSIEKEEGRYLVTYSASIAEVEPIKKTVTITIDDEAPVIEAKHVLYATKTEVNRDFVLSYIQVTDNYSKLTLDDVEVAIEPVYQKGDLVTFTVRDEAGNTTSETVQFTRTSSVKILNVQNRIVPEGTTVDQRYAMRGIEGLDGDYDVTDQIQVTISDPKDDVYTVTYELSNKYGVSTKVIAFFTVKL